MSTAVARQAAADRRSLVDWDAIPLGEVSDVEIVKEYGVSPADVLLARRERGIPTFRRSSMQWDKACLGELPDAEIANRLGCSRALVSKARRAAGLAHPVSPPGGTPQSTPPNPDRWAKDQAHKALSRGALSADVVTWDEWATVVGRRDGRCAYCSASGKTLTLDHIIPVSRGGRHQVSNLAPACKRCNSAKGARTLGEFARAPQYDEMPSFTWVA